MIFLKNKYTYSLLLSVLVFGALLIMPAFISRASFKDLIGILFCLYFLTLLIIIKKNDSKKTKRNKILILLLPAITIYLLFPLFTLNLRTLPLGVSIILSGLAANYLYRKSISLKLCTCVIVVLLGRYGYPKYSLELSYQESMINQPLNSKLNFLTQTHPNILNRSKNKIQVLEFWNSACGQCIKDFPKFQEFFETYDEDYEIYSVNVPWRRDKEKNFNPNSFVDSLGYSFPVLSMEYDEAKKLEVNLFPTVLVIDNRTIKYRGRLIYGNSSKYNITEVLKKIKE